MTKRLKDKDEEDLVISDWKFAAMVIDRSGIDMSLIDLCCNPKMEMFVTCYYLKDVWHLKKNSSFNFSIYFRFLNLVFTFCQQFTGIGHFSTIYVYIFKPGCITVYFYPFSFLLNREYISHINV